MTTQGIYDLLRQKWSDFLTGGSNYNTQDPSIAAQISRRGRGRQRRDGTGKHRQQPDRS